MSYFVSCIDGRRVALLAGPFQSHAEALSMVDAVRDIAPDIDPRTAFAAFGTCRWKADGEPPIGKLNNQLGVCVGGVQ